MLKIMYGFPGAEIRKLYYKEIAKLAKAKKKSYLLVPEQQVLAYEDESVKVLPDSAPLYFTVASFSLLSDIAQRRYGGLSYKMLTKPIKALYMWKALREVRPFLGIYKRSSPEGMCASMLECIDELKASGITSEALKDAAIHLTDSPSFAEKLKDISLIFSAYGALIGNKYSDSNDSLAKLDRILRDHRLFSGCDIFIDSFTDFTPIQLSILKKLIPSADDVYIAFPTDPKKDTSVQFEAVRKTVSELEKLADDFCIPIENVTYPSNEPPPLLSYIQKNIWKTDAVPFTGTEKDIPIEIYRCRDRHEEVYACINLIRRTLFNGGKLSDIAVIARNPSAYEKMLATAASDAGIPIFTSDRSPLSNRVFATYILSLIRIVGNGWQRDDVLAHLKCGLCGADESDIQKFELYTVRWRLNGKKQLCTDPFTAPYKSFDRRRVTDTEYTEAAERIRQNLLIPILAFEKALSEAESITAMLRAIFEYLEERSVRSELAALADELSRHGDLKAADQTARVYRSVIRLFDDMAFALEGDTAVKARELCSLLELLFSSADLGSIPTRQDEVIIADASLYRSFGHKTVILLGCSDGEFPASVKKGGIISDAEKERLRNEGLPFASSACDAASREYLYFWRSIGMASEKLIFTFPEKGVSDGQGRQSRAIDKICYLCPNVTIRTPDSAISEMLWEPYSLLTLLSASAPESRLYKTLCEWVKKQKSSPERLLRNEHSLSSPHILQKNVADKCINDPLRISPTALEDYNECAFAFFCDRILTIDKGERNEFNAATAGNLIHKAMETYLSSDGVKSLSDADIARICTKAAHEYYEEICPTHLRDNERLKVAFERAALNASVLAIYVGRDLGETRFTPIAYEYNTGITGGLTVHADKAAVISGRVDRIDRADTADESYLRVIDYKSGVKKFSLEDMKTGIELQLPIYLSSILKGQKIRPGGFMYISSAIPKIEISSASELEDKNYISARLIAGIETSGIINGLFAPKRSAKLKAFTDEEIYRILDEAEETVKNTVNEICGGNFNASPARSGNRYACEFCRYGAICRQKKSQ